MLHQLTSANDLVPYFGPFMGHQDEALGCHRIPPQTKPEDNVYGSGHSRRYKSFVSQHCGHYGLCTDVVQPRSLRCRVQVASRDW
jgi:hypothetical protein